MNDWVATVSYAIDPAVDTMDHWPEQLDATVSRVPDRGVVDVTIYAPAELHLVDVIANYVDSISEVVGAEPAGIEIVRDDEWQRRAAAPTIPELVSAAEIADELGVARQRVHQLRSSAAFPAPLAELRGGAVWDAAAVRKFAQEWERKPGRPAGRTSRRTGYLMSGHLVDLTQIEASHGIVLTQSDLNRMTSEELSRMLGETK